MSDKLIQLVQSLDRPKVLVVGDYMLDRYVFGSAERTSPEAPIVVLKADLESFVQRPGGAGSVAAAVAALGGCPIAAGIIGKNRAGHLRTALKKAGVCLDGLVQDKARYTTVKTRILGGKQQILRVDEESDGEIDDAVAKKLAANCTRAVAQADAVVVQDHAKGAVTRGLVQTLVAACATAGIPLIIDPAPKDDFARYKGATVLTPNRAEAEHATGIRIGSEEAANQAGRKLIRTLGLKAVILTPDREGVALIEKRKPAAMIPTDAVEVFDVTGAGDVVAATVAVGLASGGELLSVASLANVAAGIEGGKVGAATVSKREILERLHGGIQAKVKSRADLAAVCAGLRSLGRTTVFTNGCFDLLHIGHVRLLAEAKKLGDVLIVAINSDASARRVKGPGRPIIPEDARAGMLAALACVDYVTNYEEDTPIPLLKVVRPNVIVKGGEYGKDRVVGGKLVESMGGRIELVPMVKGFSTTEVAERARRNARKKKSGGRGYVG